MRVLSSILLRAPLLPASSLAAIRAGEDVLASTSLGTAALRRASRALSEHARGEGAVRARRNYARRAAFRPTPHGLLAGVAMARAVDGPSAIALGAPAAHLAPSFAWLSALGRDLLEREPGLRDARFRRAPSLLREDRRASWIAFGESAQARRLEVELDALLVEVLERAAGWVSARQLARALRAYELDDDATHALLLQLVDDGLLHHDLDPPLVGPPPLAWAKERLAPLHPALAGALDALEAGVEDALSGVAPASGLGVCTHATLLHRAEAPLEIARAPLERAAACAPFLFALAEALVPAVRERALVPGLDDALEAAGALVGEGLLPCAPLELGHYGARPDGAVISEAQPSVAVVARLGALIAGAARDGRHELHLDRATLAPLLPTIAPPATFELQLMPCAARADVEEGQGWLLGVHAPAGASWGRYAAALGEPMIAALHELRDAERELDGEALRVDVSYAPSRALADVCQVPALREAALAISVWPQEGALVPEQCAIAHDPASEADRGIAAGGRAIIVAPLHRVRSTTAPPSTQRALLADTLHRQHAPWALAWGPLAAWSWLPRVLVDGFVIAPQSWALPEDLAEEDLAAWRASAGVPRHLQVGLEDTLLPIDLDDAADCESLRALPPEERRRAFEIWPPLGEELDRGGRRVELVCAVLDPTRAEPEARRTRRLESLGIAPPPSAGAIAEGWRTLRIYAASERHATLLTDEIEPMLRGARVREWFFLPYVDPPGARAHLRLRVRARDDRSAAQLAAQLAAALSGAIAAGEVAAVEIGAYHPEHARYGAALPAVERIFASESQLAIELWRDREAFADLPDEALLALGLDALARGLGLSAAVRRRRCAEALAAYALELVELRERLAPGYRALQRLLLAHLGKPHPALRAHAARVRRARLPRAAAVALLPTLAHVGAVRFCGPDRDAEVRALYLWQRALESQAARVKGRAATR